MKNPCIACVVFNTAENPLVLRNLNRFLRQLAAEGLPFYVAEVALGDHAWVLQAAPNVIQLRAAADQALWYQWNLVNILEKHIPAEFDAIAWIDADVWFQRLDWYEAACEALEDYAVVQLADTMVWTGEDGRAEFSIPSAASLGKLVLGEGHPGFAWAARRSLWSEGGGLYERAIIGGGDTVNCAAWLPRDDDLGWLGYSDAAAAIAPLRQWARQNGGCCCVAGTLWHEWHGSFASRQYTERHRWLTGLDVTTHLQNRPDGLLEWSPDAPEAVKEAIRAYFQARQAAARHG